MLDNLYLLDYQIDALRENHSHSYGSRKSKGAEDQCGTKYSRLLFLGDFINKKRAADTISNPVVYLCHEGLARF